MGYINDQKDVLKKQITPKLSIKGMISDAKTVGDNKSKITGPLISPETDLPEFMLRYKGICFTLWVNLFVISMCIYQLITANSIMSFAVCVSLLIIAGMFYLKYSFSAWMARSILRNWDNRFDIKPVSMIEYVNKIAINWKEAFPLKVK